MRTTPVLRLVVAAVVCGHSAAHATTHTLTFEKVLALARESNPSAVAARYRIEEARGRRAAAERWLPGDPELGVAGGRRRGDAGSSTDFEVELTQPFELGGKRGARLAVADAEIARASADADGATSAAQAEAAERFFQILYAAEVERLYRADADAADRLVAVTQARATRGEAVDLDLQLARIASARAAAAASNASAARVNAEAELATLLGLPATDRLVVEGDLATAPLVGTPSAVASHPAIRAATAAERAGRAEEQLGESFRWPDFGLSATYAQEENDTIWLGGIVLRLPLFERGQELRATGSARARAAAAERRATGDELQRRGTTLRQRVALLREAAERLDRDAVPALSEAERLLARSFEQGVLDVRALLTTRRELVMARIEIADRRLAYAIAATQARLLPGGSR